MTNSNNFSEYIIPTGTVVGGYLVIDRVVGSFLNKRKKENEEEYRAVAESIEYEVNNSGDIPKEELMNHLSKYKGKLEALNKTLDDPPSPISEVEREISGRPMDERALIVKRKYREALDYERIIITNKNEHDEFIKDISKSFKWIPIGIGVGTGAGIALRLLDWGGKNGGNGGGGNDMNNLDSFEDWVVGGVVGGLDVLEDVAIPEEEIPDDEVAEGENPPSDTTDPNEDPTVRASARAALIEAGIPSGIAYWILRTINIGPRSRIEVGEAQLEVVADATGMTVSYLVENPEIAIAIILAAVAVAIPEPVTSVAGGIYLHQMAAATGISVFGAKAIYEIGERINLNMIAPV
jgi:hypothetical protein